MKNKQGLVASSTCILLLATTSGALAQTEVSGATLEEIIITAEKREASLQDTAASVTAYTRDSMKELNITTASDYQALVPSMSFRKSPNRISIRGVGRFSNSLGINPGVGIYSDYAYTAEATALGSRSINTERVEILRGPQGTLYGRNTTGGAVNIITRKPTEEFVFETSAKMGNYDTREFDMLISGTIVGGLQYKLFGSDIRHDGYQSNNAGADVDTDDREYYEAQLSWDITDSFNASIKYGELRYDYIPGRSVTIDAEPGMSPWDNTNPGRGSLDFSAQFGLDPNVTPNPSVQGGDQYDVTVNDPGHRELNDAHNTTVYLTWVTPFAELKYIGNKNRYEYDQIGRDSDATPSATVRTVNDIGQYQNQTTHEIQVVSNDTGGFTWLAGLYHFKDINEQPFTIKSLVNTALANVACNPAFPSCAGQAFFVPGANPDLILYHQNGYLQSESWAAYGEVGFDLSEDFGLTVGLRYSEDKMEGSEVQLTYANGALYGIPGVALDFSTLAGPTHNADSIDDSHTASWDNVSGHITLDYKPSDDHLYWGKIATGYKTGGFRLGALQDITTKRALTGAGVSFDPNEDFAVFDPEEVLMLEMGWKGSFSDTLNLTTVLFAYQYDSLQQLFRREDPVSGISLSEVVNTDMEMYGLEVEMDWLATDNLKLKLAYSYNHTEFVEDVIVEDSYTDTNVNIKGNENDQTPTHKLSVNGNYYLDTDFGSFVFGATASYVDERYDDIFNREFTALDAYTRVDLIAIWNSTSDKYGVTAAIKNLTEGDSYDSKGFSQASGSAAIVTGIPSTRYSGRPQDPRLWTVTLDYKF